MAYGIFKNFLKITYSDKVCMEKHLILLKIQNMIVVKEPLLRWFIDFLIKCSTTLSDKSAFSGVVKNEVIKRNIS